MRRVARGVRTYTSRLGIWASILRHVRGKEPSDRLWLLRSAIAAPITAWGGFDSWRNPVLLHDIGVEVPQLGRFVAHAAMRALLAPSAVLAAELTRAGFMVSRLDHSNYLAQRWGR
jgi:hypothetical protein